MPFKAQAWNCVSSLCAIVFFVHSCCVKKSFITKLNTRSVVLEECTQEYITANVQIILLSGKLELIFHKSLSMTLRKVRVNCYGPAQITTQDGLLPSTRLTVLIVYVGVCLLMLYS